MVSFGVRGVCTTTPRVEMGLDSVTAQVQIKSYALGRRRKDETEKSRSIRAARAAVGWSGSFALGGANRCNISTQGHWHQHYISLDTTPSPLLFLSRS